ncbi:MAG: hypothetical protein AB7O37_08665 [Vicinamibacteria bacterium]
MKNHTGARVLPGLGVAFFLAAAAPAGAGERAAPPAEQAFTLGLAQRELKLGLSQAELVAALGSPNLLTRDSQGRETWVYDRIATESSAKSNGFGVGAGAVGTAAGSLIGGLLSGHSQSQTTSTSQRTLTVLVRFDASGRVESFSFHASRF